MTKFMEKSFSSKPVTGEYESGWDRIWGKKMSAQDLVYCSRCGELRAEVDPVSDCTYGEEIVGGGLEPHAWVDPKDCPVCSGTGIMEDPQHGHALKCSRGCPSPFERSKNR